MVFRFAETVQKMGIFYSFISFKSVLSKVVATDDKNCLYQMDSPHFCAVFERKIGHGALIGAL